MFRIASSARGLQVALLAIAVSGARTGSVEHLKPLQRVPSSVTSVQVNIRPLRGRDWLKPDPIFTVRDRGLVRRLAVELDSYPLRHMPPSGAKFPTKCGRLVYFPLKN